jgi:hypothetical protein
MCKEEDDLLAVTAFRNTFFKTKIKVCFFTHPEKKISQELHKRENLLFLNYVRLNESLLKSVNKWN